MKPMEILFYALSVAAAGWMAVALAKRLSPPAPPSVHAAAHPPIPVEPMLAPHAAELERTRRPVLAIALEPMAQDDVTASKVGGQAYWPAGSDYPRDADGEPLYLLAQVDFAALPKLAGYPDSGLLQFFIAGDDFYGANFDTSPFDLTTQKNFRVVYWPAPLAPAVPQAQRTLANAEHMLPMNPAKPRRMRFTAGSETLGADDTDFATIFGKRAYDFAIDYAQRHGLSEDAVTDAFYAHLSRTGHKLGGYPYFTQDDPRKPGDPRRLLLQLDSDDEMMWGDVGVANFFIHPDDLARRDFSRVMYNWDCH